MYNGDTHKGVYIMSSYLLKKIYNRFDYFVSEEDIYQLLLNHELSDTRMGIRFIFPLYTILIMYFTYLRIMAIGMTNILGIIEAIGMILLLAQQMIVHRLEAHQHHIAHGHIGRLPIGIHMVKMKRAVARVNLQAMLAHIFIFLVQQEVHIHPGMRQFSTIEATDGSSSNNSVFHKFHAKIHYSYDISKRKTSKDFDFSLKKRNFAAEIA